MAYKSKATYARIASATGFDIKTVMAIDDETIHGEYTLGKLAYKYLAKASEIGRVIDMLTDADKFDP
jgi:hypothetical protein